MKDKIRIGFIGFGKRVENIYMPIFTKASSTFEISGFCTRRPDRARDITSKFSLRDLKSSEEVAKNSDVIIAFSPPETQYDLLNTLNKIF